MENKKVLLVTCHTYQNISVANSAIVNGLIKAIPGLVVDNLAELYPDFKIDVKAEQQKLLDADIIIIQSPLFWYSLSSLQKRWMEEVFAHGWAYGSTGDALKGKKVIVGITAGAPTSVYAEGSMGITIADIVKPLEVSFSFCQMEYIGTKFTGGMLNVGDGKLSEAAEAAVNEHVEWIVNKI